MFLDRPKVLHALVVVLGVAIAGAWLYSGTAADVAFGLVVLSWFSSFLFRRLADKALPGAPRRAQSLLEWTALRYVALGALLVAIPMWGAVVVGSDLKFGNRTGGRLIGFLLAFAFIEASKSVDPDGETIDGPVAARCSQVFRAAYRKQFEDQGGPLPRLEEVTLDGEVSTRPTDVWMSIETEGRHNGWGAGSRRLRAEDLQSYIANNSPIEWKA